MNNKEEINLYIEERQDTLQWIQDEVQLEILEEVVTFILNEIRQNYQTDILTLRDEENQYYEIDQIVQFKRPHTYITIPQRHDVKTLALNQLRSNHTIYHISNDKVIVEKHKGTTKTEVVDYSIENIKKLNQKYLDILKGIFDDLVIQPKKNHETQQQSIKQQNEPESPKFGQSPKGNTSPSWISKGSFNDSLKKHDLIQLTLEEVAKHNTSDSAWIVINSKVYDVTHYLSKHPGGRDQLMRGVGTDGTPLFMQNHPWVNAHYLLEHSQVGFLINHK